jgi:hypothetical protein
MTINMAFAWPSAPLVMGWFLFGSIGTVAVGYAKFKEEWFPAVIGVGLMLYPYFFPSGIGFWTIGVLLTILLFVPRRLLGL